MNPNRYTVENNPSTDLKLSGLTATQVVDCSTQPHIEAIKLYNCPAVTEIDFGGQDLMIARALHITGDWSGSIQMRGSIQSLTHSLSTGRKISIGCSNEKLNLRAGWNGLITNSFTELIEAQNTVDDLLYLSDEFAPSHVEIGLLDGLPFRHLGISDHTNIESITINCLDGGAQSIVIHNMPNLRSININGQTKLLEIERCPKLNSIHGQGNVIRANSPSGRGLKISGIWTDVDSPQWISRLAPTSEELRTCSDLAWVHIPALTYENQVKWAELFDMDITEVMEGIPIQTMIETLANQGDEFMESIQDWTLWLMTPSEQYIAMRLLTALCLRGMPKELIWKGRAGILTSNKKFHNAYHDEETLQRFSRSKTGLKNWFHLRSYDILRARDARYGLGLNSWSTSSSSIMPLDRLDIEIWIETGGVSTRDNQLMPDEVLARYRTDREATFIDAVLNLREEGEARNRQDGLMEHMFANLRNNFHGTLFDDIAQIIVNHGVEKIPEVVDQFIDALLNSNCRERAIIAISAAMMQYVDDIRLKSLMATHRSSPDIGSAEAKTLHVLSLAGRRAYTQGRVPPLEFPAIQNWRYIHD